MAKDEVTEEVVDETKTETEEKSPEIPQEVLDDQEKFDKLMDSEEDDTAAEEDPEKGDDTEEEAAKKVAGEEAAAKQTAEDKEIEEAAKAIEKEAQEVVTEKKPEPEKKVETKTETEDKPFDCGLPTEGDDAFDPDMVKAINTMGQGFVDQIAALKAEKATLAETIRQQDSARWGDWLDTKFERLGDDFEKVFGAGEYDDLEPGSVQSDNRVRLANRMNIISKAYAKLGKTVPSRNKLFDKALTYEFEKEKSKAKTVAKVKEVLAKRAAQTLGKTTQKASQLSAAGEVLKIQKDFDAKIDD